MRVLLIKPETVGIFSYTNLVDHEPLELEYLYTILKNSGHEPCIYDRRHNLTPLKTELKRFSPDMVCITGYITQEKLMIKLTQMVKSFNNNIIIIIGGSHAELNYSNFFVSKADFIYHLSGIICFMRLVEHITGAGALAELHKIPGLCYREGTDWKVTPKIVQDPNDLPQLNRTYFYKNIKRYRYLTFKPLALIKNAYSCKHSCRFCYCTNLNSGTYMCRNVEKLVDEIAAVEAPNIHITDDNFLVDREYLRRFSSMICERNIQKKFLVYGRADFIAENRDIMSELKDAGLALVMVGLEARSDEELTSYNKQATVKHNEDCVQILKELDIICAGLFIVHQDMKVADFKTLYKWIAVREIIPTISIFTPMQGSADYPECENMLLSSNPVKQDLFHCILQPKHMSVFRFNVQYYRLSAKLFWLRRKHPLYACVNYASFFFILKIAIIKMRRVFIV